ncbi:NUDIX hydrolase [Bacillus sp. 1P06AnD]|uniref:NUDIX hydrolase n=1 Tax=Bacillus sp. 1P06AnD TaxID=3132208 RepID=UPI0039A0AB11
MSYIMDLRKIVGSRPLIMAGAAVIVPDSERRILMQLRKDNGCWGLPGGSMELGEQLEETARRELFEETGIKAKNLTLLAIFSGKELYYRYPHGDEVFNVVAAYVCGSYEGFLQRQEQEVEDLRYYYLNSLPEKINPVDIPIIEAFRAYESEK